jgi:L-iditol 2-dehydrogenase
MRSATLIGPGTLEIRDVPQPTPDPDDAVVRVRSVGICGTDTKIHAGHIPVDYPRVMGHEIVGTVEAAPPEEAGLVGERVLVDPGVTCGDCPQCRAGRGNICTRGWLLGRDRDGGLRDRMEVPAANLYPVPDGIDDVAAPILQVLATCIHGQRLAPPTPGDTVAIFGLGVTGLLHLQLAKAAGASPVICATRSAEKLDLARRLGADDTVQLASGSDGAEVAERAGGGAGLVIECAGTVATLGAAVVAARIGGRVLAYGTIPERDGAFPYYDLYYKELSIVSARSARAVDFPDAIEAASSGPIRLDPLVTRRVAIEELADALAAGPGSDLKTIVDVQSEEVA